MLAIAEPTEAAPGDLPDGLHAPEGVEYLAERRGLRYKDGKLPDKLVFGETSGFSAPVCFMKSSNGRGYYLVRRDQCSCPSYRFRGGDCKHMKAARADLERKARIDERNRQKREERMGAAVRAPSAARGFNMPESMAGMDSPIHQERACQFAEDHPDLDNTFEPDW